MTKTYYLDSVALAQAYAAADVENQALADSGSLTPGSDTASIAAGAQENAFAFCGPAGEPNSADWPVASAGDPYKAVIDISSIGGDLDINFSQVIRRVASDLSTAVLAASLTWDSSTGTGIKTATNTTADPAAGTADERVGFNFFVDNNNTMKAETITLDLGTTATYMEGPWTVAAADRLPPYPRVVGQAVHRASSW